ncbi:MmcQ/YjbR family DNA-binding protein [Namhaeicola litoreus]|uniref:MmcQ/YjbR family DNA-binding protein n=1 Tax=Namhaeicola litoreus TaxID=1052145 RepID=A0ABW3XZT6_9FLAO
MNIENFRAYCLQKNHVTESFPFDDVTLVFKVCNKIFAITGLDEQDFRVNLKCNPDWAIELRESYPAVIPGYHMNKQHWNTVIIDGSIPKDLLIQLIDHSYDLILQSLTKKVKLEYGLL